MNNYWLNIIVLFKRLMLVLIIYQLCRLFFYLNNSFVFQSAGILEFLGGIRFDLSAIFFTNALIIIAHTIPGNFKYKPIYQSVLKVLFVLINIIFIATNFIDVEYFKFTSRRSTFSLITASGMQADLVRLIPVFLKDYWWIVLTFVITIIGFWKLTPRLELNKIKNNRPFKGYRKSIPYLVFLFSVGLVIIFGRGGLQRNPIKLVDAIRYSDSSVNTPLVLNTPFSILKTMFKSDNLKELNYYSESELNKIYQPIIELNAETEFEKKNIVLIILESFGEENLFLEFEGRKLTPFLDSLSTTSMYFDNAYANGRRSIDAVPSTILSIPNLMETSYISSPYSFNEVDGFNKVLKNEGYVTSFFHGAFNGSQNFQQFSIIASFDNYFGKDEYDGNHSEAEDGVWGIYDEEFLQFSVRQMVKLPQPFFSTIFTISSHNPFRVPDRYEGKFPKGNRLVHETVAYTDYALKKFFESAKKTDWYENTLFVITADHTSGDDKRDLYYLNPLGSYKIPIMVLDVGNEDFKGENSKLMSQIDILPEILQHLNYTGEFISYANIPHQNEGRMVANFNEGLYHFIIDNYYVCFDGQNILKVSDASLDKLLQTELKDYPKDFLEKKIKAYIQQFNNRIIKNRTTITKY